MFDKFPEQFNTGANQGGTKVFPTVNIRSITAAYDGNINNRGSVSPVLQQTVSVAPTATMITTSGSPSFVMQPITFTATVSPAYGSIPNGEPVTFRDITTGMALGTEPLSSGVAIFATSALSQGSHSIEAKYSGDGNFADSQATLTQFIQRYPTNTTHSSSVNPCNFGQPVTLTAEVSSDGGPRPTGTVTFYKGTQIVGTISLNSSAVAQLTTSTLPVGTHPMTAVYNRDANSASSTSPVLEQVVN